MLQNYLSASWQTSHLSLSGLTERGMMQRNGPSAYFTLISALERRRQEQEDAGHDTTHKSLYKVTSIKRIVASVVREHRAAKSRIPEKNTSLCWPQVSNSSITPVLPCPQQYVNCD